MTAVVELVIATVEETAYNPFPTKADLVFDADDAVLGVRQRNRRGTRLGRTVCAAVS